VFSFCVPNLRVLVVASCPRKVERLLLQLRSAGCDARAALETRHWASFRPQLTVVDGDMPGDTAGSLARAIRPLLNASQRLVCLTADPSAPSQPGWGAFDAVVQHPFDLAAVVALFGDAPPHGAGSRARRAARTGVPQPAAIVH
jgi:CheY-like chemotaxis protein